MMTAASKIYELPLVDVPSILVLESCSRAARILISYVFHSGCRRISLVCYDSAQRAYFLFLLLKKKINNLQFYTHTHWFNQLPLRRKHFC